METVLDPATIRWIGFSHFESDECGALNDWLGNAPHAEPVCSFVGARTSVGDFSDRPPRVLEVDERIETGSTLSRHRDQACAARVGCQSDVRGNGFHAFLFRLDRAGVVMSRRRQGDIVGRSLEYNERQSEGPMSGAVPFTDETIPILESLANLNPKTLACMHGSALPVIAARRSGISARF